MPSVRQTVAMKSSAFTGTVRDGCRFLPRYFFQFSAQIDDVPKDRRLRIVWRMRILRNLAMPDLTTRLPDPSD
jgi:hypothetical protein